MIPRKLTSATEHMRIALRVYTAFDMLERRGDAALEEWRDLCDAINITESLCDIGKIDAEHHRPLFVEATNSMAEAMEMFGELGRIRVSDRGMDALRELVKAYDLAIGRFSQKTLAEAHAHFVLKVAQAKRKPDPSVRVVSP